MESRYFKGYIDTGYLQFNKKLIFTTYPMEGVRLPVIRQIAKTLINNEQFLTEIPVTYEEVMLHGFTIAASDFDIDALINRVDGFLPYIDNWAVCDSVGGSLKKFAKHKAQVLSHFSHLKDSPNTFDRRFLAVLLMDYFFADGFVDSALELLLQIRQGEYYVDMAIAWTIATLAAKYFDKAYAIMTGDKINPFILKRSISKSLESYRLSAEEKERLKALKGKR